MTFNDIVAEEAARLNLSSIDALARLGRETNIRYKRLTTSLGLVTSRRATVTATATPGSQYITITSIEKLITLSDPTVTPNRVLDVVSFEEIRTNPQSATDSPTKYAIAVMGATSVEVFLEAPAVTAFTLTADVHEIKSTLKGTDEPAFSESYHDILVEGVMSDELRKKGDLSGAGIAENMYEKRLGELKYWVAKSSWQDIVQNKFVRRRSVRNPAQGIS
jgi:hypothetical protein